MHAPAIITRKTIQQAAGAASWRYGADSRWAKAIATAQAELAKGMWAWFAGPQVLKIASATREGRWYTVTEHACGGACEASAKGFMCWHRAAWQIVSRAQRTASAQHGVLPARRPRDLDAEASRQADVDDLFG